MALTVGLVGLPNVGKSTLFNALTQGQAEASAYPFCTLDPNVGVVAVPDERLTQLQAVLGLDSCTPTAIQYGINAIAIVFNDNAYGNVLRAQIEDFDDHIIGTRLHNPDLVAMAESFGVPASRAEEAEELGSALADAIDRDEPALIEVPVGMMEREF